MLLPEPDGNYGPLGVITCMCPDAYEVDDTWLNAAPVAHGDVQVHSFDSDPILYAADKDYMGFILLPHHSALLRIPLTD